MTPAGARVRERLARRSVVVRMRPRRWSVRTRLAIVSLIAATFGLSVAGLTAYIVTSRVLHQQIDESLRSTPNLLAGTQTGAPSGSPTGGPRDPCTAIESSRAPSPGLFTVEVIKSDGTVCQDSQSAGIELIPSDFDHTGSGISLRDGRLANGHHARVAVTVDADDNLTLVAARDTDTIVNVLTILKLTLVGVTLLGALLALWLSRWTTPAGLRPITQFTQVAERIAETGALEEHVSSIEQVEAGSSHDELDRLSHAFNKMTIVLADAQHRQRRLVADAGHELRTPLTSLRANVALLQRSRTQRRPLPDAEHDRLLADLTSQVRELSSLVDDLAELAFSDSTRPSLERVRFDECVEDAVHRAKSRTSDHEIRVELTPWVVRGNAASLERAAVNLLDNAIKFSPAGSLIEVDLREGALSIADRGPGIVASDRRHVFDRFWRSPSARAMPGSGLGLSIVHDVAHHHGGSTELTERPGGGTIAWLRIPGSASD